MIVDILSIMHSGPNRWYTPVTVQVFSRNLVYYKRFSDLQLAYLWVRDMDTWSNLATFKEICNGVDTEYSLRGVGSPYLIVNEGGVVVTIFYGTISL